MAGTIHRFELVIGLFDFDRAEHILFVKICMARSLPEVEPHDVRRVNKIVATLDQLIAQPGLNDAADEAALGMPKDQARPSCLLNAEQIEFRSKLAVIATPGFFETVEIFVELLLREKRRGVDALQLRVAFLALPISACDAHQLERLNAFGGRNVRAAAEI